MNEPDLSALVRRPDLANRQVGFDLVLLDPSTETVHVLNPVGAAVWHHLTPDRSFQAVVDALLMAFPSLDPDRVAADVGAFVDRLVDAKLLLPAGQEPPPAAADLPGSFTIPDARISAFEAGYVAPDLQSFTLAEIEELDAVEGYGFSMVSRAFSDIWIYPDPSSWVVNPVQRTSLSWTTRPMSQ